MSYYQGCFRWCKKWCNVVSVVLFFSKCQLDYNSPKIQKFPGAYTMNEANEEIFDVVDENGIAFQPLQWVGPLKGDKR